jgi:lipopolysaccharide/colanic/teichoic acid biosynthesis glycosyltransferase
LPEVVSVLEESGADSSEMIQKSDKAFALAAKRLIDIMVSLILLFAVLPLFPIIALIIYLDSPGPVFFKPRIIGYGGQEFDAYKFRTMHPDAFKRLLKDPILLEQYKKNLKLKDDPRVTRVGYVLRKTSIDELPQLINVLKGEMSLVGPRMLAELELEKFGEHRNKILSVKPGMAGLWVASGRQNLSFEERVRLELIYVDSWSLWLDTKCFLKTILIAIGMVGAH